MFRQRAFTFARLGRSRSLGVCALGLPGRPVSEPKLYRGVLWCPDVGYECPRRTSSAGGYFDRLAVSCLKKQGPGFTLEDCCGASRKRIVKAETREDDVSMSDVYNILRRAVYGLTIKVALRVSQWLLDEGRYQSVSMVSLYVFLGCRFVEGEQPLDCYPRGKPDTCGSGGEDGAQKPHPSTRFFRIYRSFNTGFMPYMCWNKCW